MEQAAAAEDVSGDGGVLKTTVRCGSGERPVAHSRVTATYVGTLASGEVFDRSPEGGNFSFVLGKGEVISGWDAGFAAMRVGEVAQLEIRHDHGYGEAGLPGRIPPHAVLFFEVELLAAAASSDEGSAAGTAAAASGGGAGASVPLPIEDGVAGEAPEEAAQQQVLVVDGAPVALDHLGPIVLNKDGSMSRITNWHEMTEVEQQRTLRVVAKRNKSRRSQLQAEGGGGTAGE
eukprot:COSAG06_NODE_2045_length_7751_cov_1.725039_4_plen_232_part_00